MLVTSGGVLIRMGVKDISLIGRNTQGVRLITLDDEKEKVVGISHLPKDETVVEGEPPVEGEPVVAAVAAEPPPEPPKTE
jgi:DNA gyrase subunit A